MRENPKLFQLWPRPTYATSGHAHTLQSFSSLKLNRIYILALVVIVVSAIAWIVGGVVLALHWTQVSDLPLHTATIDNAALHANLSANTSPATTSTNVAPAATSAGTTSASTVNQTNATASTTAGQANNSTTVTVNGEDIPVPDNGSISKEITNDNGTTSVHVSSGTQTDSNSNVSVQVNSTSSSTSSGGTQ